MMLNDYRYEVSARMLTIYGIDWNDACGDDAPLQRAINDGESAEEFVEWWGQKFNLTTLFEVGIRCR